MKGMIGTPTETSEGLLLCTKCQRMLDSVSRQQYLIFKKTGSCLKCFRDAGGWRLINRDRANEKRAKASSVAYRTRSASPLSSFSRVVFVKSLSATDHSEGGPSLG